MATDLPLTTATEPLINGTINVPGANGTGTAAESEPPASLEQCATTSETKAPGLTADEIALYDRQIRLWGAQAQERIRSAKVLLISLRALGTEIAKNLTLAGIHSLTIVDEEPVTAEDLGPGFFFREEDVGKPRSQAGIPRIQEMNPLVSVQSGGSLSDILSKTQEYYSAFHCVIACDHDFLTLSAINTAARLANCTSYCAGIHGLYGFIFADLISHEFVIERAMSNIPTKIGPESMTRQVLGSSTRKETDGKITEIVKKAELYCPLILANSSPLPLEIINSRRKLKGVTPFLPCLRALWEFQRNHSRSPGHMQQDLVEFTTMATIKSRELQLPPETLRSEFLRSFIQNIGAEMTPTAAFVGGRLSEDVINVMGKREQPIQNLVLFDGDALEGKIYSMYSPPPEVAIMAGVDASGMGMGGYNGNGMGMNMGMPMDMNMMNGGEVPVDLSMMNGNGMAGIPGMQGMGVGMGMAMQAQTQGLFESQQHPGGTTNAPTNGEGGAYGGH